MLSQYHEMFLENFHRHNVEYLVIGGQAKAFHNQSKTCDLDVWAHLDEGNSERLRRALKKWIVKYPTHNTGINVKEGQLVLKPKVQITFPTADVWYLNKQDEQIKIGQKDGIDILTSVGEMSFADCYSRSSLSKIGEIIIRYLSVEDLALADGVRVKSESESVK